MFFNSFQFILVFLPAALVGYWILMWLAGRTAAVGWLLLASIVFYASGSLMSLAIIAPSIILDYLIARAMLRRKPFETRLRTLLFAAGIAANIAFLGYFKYKNFFLDTANTLFATHFELTKLILPLGISFLTFQKIAFLADVQSGQVKDVRLFDFVLFTLFFPRTIAGPIVHYGEVMPQLSEIQPRSMKTDVAVGICLFSIGLFKKTVIADGIAQFVADAFDPPTLYSDYSLVTAWTGAFAYTFQLYFDFSGYSDMALGTARMFGVRLPMNFNSPLKASSIVDFWNRWHITLTRFLTAYIFTPIVRHLTRARISKGKPVLWGTRPTFSAICVIAGLPSLITLTISGLWHGAGWQFIVWGIWHGIVLTINQSWRILRPRFWPDQASYERVMKPLGFVLTFVTVMVGLVLFRASSIASALSILSGMAGMNGVLPHDLQLLEKLGISFPWSIIWDFITYLKWIVVLFLAITLLPNSLELLRRFHPALDFPEENGETRDHEAPTSGAVYQLVRPSTAGRFRGAWTALRQLGDHGISLNNLTAMFVALLLMFGIMALGRGGAFVYLQF